MRDRIRIPKYPGMDLHPVTRLPDGFEVVTLDFFPLIFQMEIDNREFYYADEYLKDNIIRKARKILQEKIHHSIDSAIHYELSESPEFDNKLITAQITLASEFFEEVKKPLKDEIKKLISKMKQNDIITESYKKQVDNQSKTLKQWDKEIQQLKALIKEISGVYGAFWFLTVLIINLIWYFGLK